MFSRVLLLISDFFLFFVLKFGELGGFAAIQTKLSSEEIEIAVRTSLPLFPFLYHITEIVVSHVMRAESLLTAGFASPPASALSCRMLNVPPFPPFLPLASLTL